MLRKTICRWMHYSDAISVRMGLKSLGGARYREFCGASIESMKKTNRVKIETEAFKAGISPKRSRAMSFVLLPDDV